MSAELQTAAPPDVARAVAGFARALVGAARSRRLYSADHPSAALAVGRLQSSIERLVAFQDVQVGVSPDTLFVNGEPLAANRLVAEAAEFLNDHDILRLRVASVPTPSQLSDFLELLSSDANDLRRRGGPAACWSQLGHRCLVIDQIDYGAILAAHPGPATGGRASPAGGADSESAALPRDSVWHTLVRSLATDSATLQQSVQQRLQEIAQSADGIEALTAELVGVQSSAASANSRPAQAATVLFAFERLVRQVESTAPEALPDALRNIATAASRLDPDLLMQTVWESAESGVGSDAARAIGGWLDDEKVARLLARSMGGESKATGRLASALNTLAPDPGRQHRVLRLARTMVRAPDGQVPFDVATAWQSIEDLLDTRNDGLFTLADYSQAIQEAERRSYVLRLQAPEDLESWTASVSSESIRTLSVTLLLDLFALEDSPAGIAETAVDLATAAEDLLSAGDLGEAYRILEALDPAVLADSPCRASAARQALDRLALSPAIGTLGQAAGDFHAFEFEWFRWCCTLLGPGVVEPLVPVFAGLPDGQGRNRVGSVISQFGSRAIEVLKPLLASPEWPICRAAMQLTARVGGPAAAAALQPLARDSDTRRSRGAVAVMVELEESSAYHALASLLKTGSLAERAIAVDTLAAYRDSRSSEMIAAALGELDPCGPDIELAMQMLDALRDIGDERAVAAIVALAEVSDWRRPRQAMRVKRAAIEALAAMPGSAAGRALLAAAARGGWLVRRFARAARREGH